MHPPQPAPLFTEAAAPINRWLDLWRTPDLVARTTIEWSPRLTRSLGRCYPEHRLIRLAGFLNAGLDEAETALLEEVLFHELARLAARELHRTRIRPHGPEWKSPPSPRSRPFRICPSPLTESIKPSRFQVDEILAQRTIGRGRPAFANLPA